MKKLLLALSLATIPAFVEANNFESEYNKIEQLVRLDWNNSLLSKYDVNSKTKGQLTARLNEEYPWSWLLKLYSLFAKTSPSGDLYDQKLLKATLNEMDNFTSEQHVRCLRKYENGDPFCDWYDKKLSRIILNMQQFLESKAAPSNNLLNNAAAKFYDAECSKPSLFGDCPTPDKIQKCVDDHMNEFDKNRRQKN